MPEKRGRGRPRKHPMKGSGACLGKQAGEECAETGTVNPRKTIASANRTQRQLASEARKAAAEERRQALQESRALRESQRAAETARRALERQAKQMQRDAIRAEKKAYREQYMNELKAMQKESFVQDVLKIYTALLKSHARANQITETDVTDETREKFKKLAKDFVTMRYSLEQLYHIQKVFEHVDTNYEFGKPIPGLPVIREKSDSPSASTSKSKSKSNLKEDDLLREIEEAKKLKQTQSQSQSGGKKISKSKSKSKSKNTKQ